jgi:hypothetical protein
MDPFDVGLAALRQLCGVRRCGTAYVNQRYRTVVVRSNGMDWRIPLQSLCSWRRRHFKMYVPDSLNLLVAC